jgi:hypothetical protein
MTLYNVHIYREMRLYFPGIEADEPEQAAKTAADMPTGEAEYTEDCDGDNFAALVDVVSDDEFERSVTIDFEPERLRKAATELLSALKDARRLILDMGRIIRGLDDNHDWLEFWTQDGSYLCCDSRFDAIAKAIAKVNTVQTNERPA